jgi:hypothetical protein
MITQQTPLPTIFPPAPMGSAEDERPDRTAEEMIDDQWISDFIGRLNYVIQDIVRDKK